MGNLVALNIDDSMIAMTGGFYIGNFALSMLKIKQNVVILAPIPKLPNKTLQLIFSTVQ